MNYVCKYCGTITNSSSMAQNQCYRSPTKYHVIIQEAREYVCKFCGQKSNSPSFAQNQCYRSPHGTHELIG